MSDHTPGPWHHDLGSWVYSKVPTQMSDFDTAHYYGGSLVCESVGNADATLIAAAPDMLQALKAVQAAITKHAENTGDVIWIEPPYQIAGVHESAWERLDVVIAKAEGRE